MGKKKNNEKMREEGRVEDRGLMALFVKKFKCENNHRIIRLPSLLAMLLKSPLNEKNVKTKKMRIKRKELKKKKNEASLSAKQKRNNKRNKQPGAKTENLSQSKKFKKLQLEDLNVLKVRGKVNNKAVFAGNGKGQM